MDEKEQNQREEENKGKNKTRAGEVSMHFQEHKLKGNNRKWKYWNKIELGQRVKKFSVEAKKNGKWQKVADATTIGYKRILPIKGIQTNELKITFEESKACPVISSIGIY